MVGLGEQAAQRLDAAVAAIGTAMEGYDDARLRHAPAPDEWSAMQVLGHVTELMPFWAHRARLIADGTLADRSFDRTPEEMDARIQAVEDAANRDVGEVLARLRAAAHETGEVLRGIPDEGWTRTALRGEDGPRQSAAEMVEQRVVGHVEQHARQMEAAIASSPAPAA